MLAAMGFITIALVVVLIITKRTSAPVAIMLIPIITGAIVGHWAELGGYITTGLKGVAANAAMFAFSVIFFGMMSDTGVFDVIVSKILKLVGKDPLKICLATTLVATIGHLDGAGATTCLITIPVFMPIYDRMKMRRIDLAYLVVSVIGVMNMVPWGGPTMRAITAMESSVEELYSPMIPVQVIGMIVLFILSFLLGKKESKRLADVIPTINIEEIGAEELSPEAAALRRPKLFVVNLALTVGCIVALFMGLLNNAACFMLFLSVGCIINYPSGAEQRKIFDMHAKDAMGLVCTILAAGLLSGIMKGTGMLEAMSLAILNAMPAALAQHLAVVVGVIAHPLNIFTDPDSFYYVMLPVLSNTAEAYGIPALSVARAAICGHTTTAAMLSPLIGTSFLACGMLNLDLGDIQKRSFLPLWIVSIIMVFSGVALGLIAF